jgi:hypothetical protein
MVPQGIPSIIVLALLPASAYSVVIAEVVSMLASVEEGTVSPPPFSELEKRRLAAGDLGTGFLAGSCLHRYYI